MHVYVVAAMDYPGKYVLLQGLLTIVCVVAGIIHGIMCCCRDYPWDYVWLRRSSMRLCVVAGIMCCCRDYPWDYVLLQGLSMGLCVVVQIIHEIMCC